MPTKPKGEESPIQTGNPHTKKKKARKPAKQCGALTRNCACGHRRNEHAGGLGRCAECGDGCETFRALPCKSNKLGQNGRCRMHGGTAKTGMASPAWRNGRWGALLKGGLRDGFYAALSDPTLLQLQQEAALVDTLLQQLLGSIKANPTEAQRREILKLTAEHRAIVEAAGRMERHLGLFVPRAQFAAFVTMVVQLFREFVVGADGKPNTVALLQIKQRLEANVTLLVAAKGVAGEEPAEEEAEG